MSQKNPCEDLLELLLDSSAGDIGDFAATTGWGIYLGEMPDKPDSCILLRDGIADWPPAPNYDYEYPSVQIRVRNKKGGFSTAYSKIKAIKDVLHGRYNETINDSRYIQILVKSDIEFIGFDENQRPIYVMNLSCQRTATI